MALFGTFLCTRMKRKRAETNALTAHYLQKKSRIRTRCYLTQKVLVKYEHSPFAVLFKNGVDQEFIYMTGCTRDLFLHLLSLLDIPDGRYVAREGKLGMTLFYLNSTMKIKTLSMLFGCTEGTVSRFIHECLKDLERILPTMPDARLQFPNFSQALEFAKQVKRRANDLDGVFGFVDGCSFPMKEPSDMIIQARFYNSWKRYVSVANVFGYTPDGCIFYARINYPGSCGDSGIAEGLTELINSKLPKGFKVLADSAFPRSDRILTSRKKGAVDKIIDNDELEQIIREHTAVVGVRQAAEWGMRGLQGSFARLTEKLPLDADLRRRIISVCVWLHNAKTRVVGINQIRTVYGPAYNPALVHTNDLVHQYYSLVRKNC